MRDASPALGTETTRNIPSEVKSMLMSPASDLLTRVDVALRSTSQLRRHPIELANQEGCVVVRGQVATFHQKQIVQEIIRRVDGVRGVDNQLVVDWPLAVNSWERCLEA